MVGWLVFGLMLVAIAAVIYGLRRLDHFLSLTRPIQADVMVMEGWMPDETKKQVLQQYWQGGYRRLIVTGGPISHGAFLTEYKNHADLGLATLIALGMDPAEVVAIPTPRAACYRTAAAALSLKQYICQEGITGFNLYSCGSHTRRSYYIFRQVFSPDVAVGAVAMPTGFYDPDRWWTTSHGFRAVVSEAIAYLYVRLIRWRD
ncbi:cytosine deaminase [filamentous cyanobacterium CCP5]|nr:cytosine deaminase [filamentous cyanobacterium CCP5]